MNEIIIENFKKLINLIIVDNSKLNKDTEKKNIIMNNFRIKSLKKVILIISKLSFIIKSIDQVKNIPGIGKGSIQRIEEILLKKSLVELKNYDKIVEKNNKKEQIINDLMNVVGIGRVIAISLIDNYNIKSANELKKIVNDAEKKNQDLLLINDKIKLGLKYLGKFEGSIPRSEITNIYDYLQNITDKFNTNMFITICGSYRRELPVSSDIDILLIHMDIITMEDLIEYNSKFIDPLNLSTNLLSSYVNYLHKKKFIIDDITDKNIKTKYMGFCQYIPSTSSSPKIRRVDIRLIPMISYWYALLYFTGSYEFNQNMRSKAKKLGYKLNEYGLFDLKKTNNEMLVVTSEQEIFEKLEMNYLQPSQR